MAKFVYLFIDGGVPEDELEASQQRWEDWSDGLGSEYVEGAPLGGGYVVESPDEVEEFLMHDDDVSGYVVVDVEDIDAAVELCRDCPIFEEGGHLEIREVMPVEVLG